MLNIELEHPWPWLEISPTSYPASPLLGLSPTSSGIICSEVPANGDWDDDDEWDDDWSDIEDEDFEDEAEDNDDVHQMEQENNIPDPEDADHLPEDDD